MVTKKIDKTEKLKKENHDLRRALAVCLNKPLIEDIKGALSRIEKGEYVGKDEFLKQSPLKCGQ